MTEELKPGIFSFDHSVAEGKTIVILAERGAVVVDVGIQHAEGHAMAAFIREQGLDPNRVILTHGHSDHILGGDAFRNADVFAHVAVPSEIRAGMARYAAAKAISYDDLMATVLHPTITFRGELFLDMGDKTIHVFPTPGHSADHTSVYIPEDRFLFAADTVVTGIIPAIFHDSRALERSLETIAAMEIETLAAGHGPPLIGQTAIQDWLDWMLSYIRRTRDFAVDHLAAHPEATDDEIAARADYDVFVGDRLDRDSFFMVRRHQTTVAKICAEARSESDAAERDA